MLVFRVDFNLSSKEEAYGSFLPVSSYSREWCPATIVGRVDINFASGKEKGE